MAQTLQDFYAQNAGLLDVGFDSILACLSTLMIFLGLPAMDLILGLDPKQPSQVAAPFRLSLKACKQLAMHLLM